MPLVLHATNNTTANFTNDRNIGKGLTILLFVVAATLTNVIVLLVIRSTAVIGKTVGLLINCSALADLLLALIYAVFIAIAVLSSSWPYEDRGKVIFGVINNVLWTISMFCASMLAYDRYVALTSSLHYEESYLAKNASRSLYGVCSISLIFWCLSPAWAKFDYDPKQVSFPQNV